LFIRWYRVYTTKSFIFWQEDFEEDTKGVIRTRKSKDRQHTGQKKNKQQYTKH
jgi:hypothetical protein